MTEYDVLHFIFGLLGTAVAEAHRVRNVLRDIKPKNTSESKSSSEQHNSLESQDSLVSQRSNSLLDKKYAVLSMIIAFGGGVLAMGFLEGVQQNLILASFMTGLGAEATFAKVIRKGLDALDDRGNIDR